MADEVHVSNPRHDASKTGELERGPMASGSDTQSALANDDEPQSKWEAFKDKVGDTVSSMRENAREEVGVFIVHRYFGSN
ncbi:hypothetical protein FOMPIDRAFT_1047071 [Fomitopsis schrenkii]|uniref:Uncharacterized protein n=1 Tax=Fomitopsis schrenkii TaxID=2126942 RepID=S8EJP0_FOMSC|nr:hypothetical protein FOMPIDRAFT_1047071 [Fomitopsis schrenkii]